MSAAALTSFAAVAVLLAFVPGPDNLYVISQSALRGTRTGLAIVAGLCTGLVVQTLVVALGIGAIFQQSQLAFDLLKYAGSAYLIYLAWQAFKSKPQSVEEKRDAANNLGRSYLKGILMNISNPKVTVFFLAFLPQFVDPEAGHVMLQMLTLGAIFIVCAFVSFCIMTLAASQLGNWLTRSARAQTFLNRLSGVVFIGLAIKLATTSQE